MVTNNCNVICYNIIKLTPTRIQINKKTAFLPSCTSQDIDIKKQHEISMRTKACKKMFFFVRFSDAVHSFSNILDKTENIRTKLLGQCKKCLEKHKISQNSVKILLLWAFVTKLMIQFFSCFPIPVCYSVIIPPPASETCCSLGRVSMQQASKEPADSIMRFCLCDESGEINEDFIDKMKGLF